MKRMPMPSGAQRQRGVTLIVAVVLLLLAGVMTLLALNVGLFEQRSTASDLRNKYTNEIAEAALAQGFEFLMRNNKAWLNDGSARWTRCTAADISFPCGAITDDTYDHDGDPATAEVSRRASFYHLNQTTHTIPDLANELANYMLPLPNKIANVGNNERVAYGVAPLLCLVERPAVGAPADTPIHCGDGTGSGASTLRVVTFVSVAKMPDENASTTLVQTLGSYPLLGDPAGKPPIIASGSVDITGTLQIVGNPNGGGPGVPVSIWTRRDVDKTGTSNTCYADEFFRYTKGSVTPTLSPATCPTEKPDCQILVCDECQCDAKGSPSSLSYDSSGNLQAEGIDILDVEGNSLAGYQDGTHEGANYNVRSDEHSYPLCEFPPDLFKHVFRVAAWEDVNPPDCFAETKIMAQYDNPNTLVVDPVTIGADEKFLYERAGTILNPTTQGTLLRRPDQVPGAAGNIYYPVTTYPSPQASGLVWCQQNCNIGSNTVLGSPLKPVVLVIDGSATIQGRIFGLVFLRNTGTGNMVPALGGNATLDMNAGAAVYGSVVIQGQVSKANGTAAVIYDKKVLEAVAASFPDTPATLPGAWTDLRSY